MSPLLLIMVKVKFFTLLRLMLEIKEVDVKLNNRCITVNELLQKVENMIKKSFVNKMLDEKGEMLRGTIILVNGKNILHIKKLNTTVRDGDIVSLFPPGGGG